EYYVRRSRAKDRESASAAHLWAGRVFGDKVVRSGFGRADAVYTFTTAAQEILTAAKKHGLFSVIEQTIASRATEEDLLAEEQRRFPGWSSSERGISRYTGAIMERERREWGLADLILCGSAFVKDSIAVAGGPAEKCVVVPYGVDNTFPPIERGSRPGPLRVLSVGEAGLRKGITYAFEVATRLAGTAEFRWVGPITLDPKTSKRVAERIHLTGAVARNQILPHFQ